MGSFWKLLWDQPTRRMLRRPPEPARLTRRWEDCPVPFPQYCAIICDVKAGSSFGDCGFVKEYNFAGMKLTERLHPIALLVLAACNQVHAQAPQPNGGDVRIGTLPRTWQAGGPQCLGNHQFQVQEYNQDLYVFRESGCANYEKPFLYLLFGKEKAFLLDTGAGKTDVAQVVNSKIKEWLSRKNRQSIPLIVAHTHAHGDHISGDGQFKALPHTTVVEPKTSAVLEFFGFRNWPTDVATYDLGGRVLDVIPIPGHEASSVAIYDRQTGILFTGDTLYPGRLYVEDPSAFTLSIQRLVDFTQGKIVTHLLGNHIEQTRTAYLDYPIGTIYQPDEHELELGRAHLLELNDALRTMNGRVVRMAFRDFTIWPK
jgi:hydroxyacylglutathione hydrolase